MTPLAWKFVWTMAASWVLGVLWIVAFYLDPTLPVLNELGNWNLMVGFVLLVAGAGFGAAALVATMVAGARRRGRF